MELWIEHIAEPKRLILTWQAPYSEAERTIWAVGELASEARSTTFRYYFDDEFSARNAGRDMGSLRRMGYAGYPAFDLSKGPVVFSEGVIETFLRRLPPPSRPDFAKYLRHFRLEDVPESPIALLGATAAKLPSDGFALIDPLDENLQVCELVFEIAGHRHYPDASQGLREGQEIQLIADDNNQYDECAVCVRANGLVIGYVGRLQAPTIRQWLRQRVLSAWLVRLNGAPSAPRAYGFLRVRPMLNVAAA